MNIKSVLLVLATVVLFGLSAFLRKLSVDRIHPYQLQIVAGIVYALELPLWAWLISKNPNIGNYNASGVFFGVLCLLSYVAAAVMFGSLMKSSNSIGALSVMIAMNPIVTSLLSYFFLNEEFTTKKIIATIITLAGVCLFNL